MTTLSKRKKIISAVNKIPEILVDDIYNYLEFLKFRNSKNDIIETALASESALAKDWLKQEEDKAWVNL